jgi:hypothetical protein
MGPLRKGNGMANRLEESIKAMAERYRQFVYSETSVGGERRGLWVGKVRPIREDAVPFDLLDDLYHNAPVLVRGDRVLHWSGCKRKHCDHGLAISIADLSTEFQLELTHNGTSALPRCRVVAPVIPREKANHLWGDGAMCALIASDWNYKSQTVADLMEDHLLWLVKWMVFAKTKVWLGAEHGNTPDYHLQILHKKDLCWCGSGEQYRRCCRARDLQAVQEAQTRHGHWLNLIGGR